MQTPRLNPRPMESKLTPHWIWSWRGAPAQASGECDVHVPILYRGDRGAPLCRRRQGLLLRSSFRCWTVAVAGFPSCSSWAHFLLFWTQCCLDLDLVYPGESNSSCNISSKVFLILDYIGAVVKTVSATSLTANPAIKQPSYLFGHHFMQTLLSTGPGADKELNR